MRKQQIKRLLKDSFNNWKDNDAFNSSVILSYYTIFSLPGLMVIIVTLAGYFFGEQAVTNQISAQIGSAVGEDTAKSIEEMIAKASQHQDGLLATVIGAVTLILGATGAFYQLRQIMNKIWGVQSNPKRKVMSLVLDRVASLGLILMIGFLLLVSLVLSAAVTSLTQWVGDHVSQGLVVFFTVLDFILSIAVITFLFAAMFKYLPQVQIPWKYVWPGAVLTAVLFVIAKFALALYFSKTDPGSTYGAAGSIVLLLLWVTYSGLILFFGAEFTKVYAKMNGAKVRPAKGAVRIAGNTHTVRTPMADDAPDRVAAPENIRDRTESPGADENHAGQERPRSPGKPSRKHRRA